MSVKYTAKTLHFTREEIMAMPGYCQRRYEYEIEKLEAELAEARREWLHDKQGYEEILQRLEGVIAEATKILNEFPVTDKFHPFADLQEIGRWVERLRSALAQPTEAKTIGQG